MGFYYISLKEHLLLLYSGLFYLRAKLKNNNYCESIKNNIEKIDYTDKAILNLAKLPRNLFGVVMKFYFTITMIFKIIIQNIIIRQLSSFNNFFVCYSFII